MFAHFANDLCNTEINLFAILYSLTIYICNQSADNANIMKERTLAHFGCETFILIVGKLAIKMAREYHLVLNKFIAL
jgi:hypothetical protein